MRQELLESIEKEDIDKSDIIENTREFLVLKKCPNTQMHGEVLIKIASSFWYCQADGGILDLSIDLSQHKDIMAVAVVDDKLHLLGIITRNHLFDILGKPYGRDVMKYKIIKMLAKKMPEFDYLRNIFSISEEISFLLHTRETRYFVLTKDKNKYAGIFSTIDMLIYLSAITQKDINLARQLQNSIVKDEEMISGKDFKIVGATRMAKGVGGDYYSIKELKNGNWSLSICDVSGKGVAASLITTAISGMFNIFSYSKGIKTLIKKVNSYLFQTFEAEKFVTGVFLDFDPHTGKCRLYDMGHSYMFISRDQDLFRIKSNNENMPLGITPESVPQEGSTFILRIPENLK